jgi:hypothetical protein
MGMFTELPGGTQITLRDRFAGARGAFLVGGAPSLRDQPLELLRAPGVLCMAMNNAALHVRPSLWVGCDPPACFDTSILLDPGILKFCPRRYADMPAAGGRYGQLPNAVWFEMAKDDRPVHRYFDHEDAVPWNRNTMTGAIFLLYHLGIRKIVLLGSDFGAGYAHPTALSRLERRWNAGVYNALVADLLVKRAYFEARGLELVDASVHSRLASRFRTMTLEQALAWLDLPLARQDSRTLPHCSKFANADLKRRIGGL